MKPNAKKTSYKRIALALSLCALIIWGILGTGASLAWFTDTSPEINNIFHFADFDLVVAHRLPMKNGKRLTVRPRYLMKKRYTNPATCRSYI